MKERIVITGFLKKEHSRKIQRGKNWMEEWAIHIQEESGVREIQYYPYRYYIVDPNKFRHSNQPFCYAFQKAPKILKNLNDGDPVTVSVNVQYWDNGNGAYISNPRFVVTKDQDDN